VAVRIIRACKEMGIETVAVYSEADRNSLPVALADERICIGGNAAAESYLNQKNIISAALATNAEAIHPGYGFLSENAGFAKLCEENGIVFIGPKSEVISAMGDKDTSRQLMQQVGVPVVPGTEVLKDVEEAKKYAKEIGYPLLVKATAGGGGKGIRVVAREEDLADAYCNFCMKTADNGKNEVLVVSPILEAYIRKNYPGFTINSSTCKEIRGIEGVNEELKKDYGLVVLDYNLNNQFGELQKITDKSRCELLVNACCIPECPRRGEHYRTIAKQQRITLKNRRHPADKQIPVPGWHCEYGNCNTIYDIQEYKTFISAEDIWEKYLPMGFCNFKIEGRTADYFNLIDTYCYYLMEPKYRDEARLLLLMNLERSRVIRVSKPKPGNWQ